MPRSTSLTVSGAQVASVWLADSAGDVPSKMRGDAPTPRTASVGPDLVQQTACGGEFALTTPVLGTINAPHRVRVTRLDIPSAVQWSVDGTVRAPQILPMGSTGILDWANMALALLFADGPHFDTSETETRSDVTGSNCNYL